MLRHKKPYLGRRASYRDLSLSRSTFSSGDEEVVAWTFLGGMISGLVAVGDVVQSWCRPIVS
eukprot:scaffold141835_cov23-Cyclotella_meneghiniana.AAC.1